VIVIKEEFVGGEKYSRAQRLGGSDAIVMWLALKAYASKHPSCAGFIPDEDLDRLLGAPAPRVVQKALRALVECGRLLPDGSRGPGLVEPVPSGWQLHDYLDHSQAPEELELRRERARLKKQRQREEQRRELELVRSQTRDLSPGQMGDNEGQLPGDTSGDDGGDEPRDVPGTSLAGARTPGPAPARTGARPQPSPTLSNPLVSAPDPEARTRPDDGSFIVRTFTMPEGGPTKEYFDECTLAGVGREQAVSTWNHYRGAGLPERGVERLPFWLAQRAKEKATRDARVDRGSLLGRAADDAGTQGHLRVEPQQDHRRFADKHGLKLEDYVDRVRKDPRYKNLGTVDAWRVLTRMLESAAKQQQQKRGAA
jgi:hypothetical protein